MARKKTTHSTPFVEPLILFHTAWMHLAVVRRLDVGL